MNKQPTTEALQRGIEAARSLIASGRLEPDTAAGLQALITRAEARPSVISPAVLAALTVIADIANEGS